MMSEWKVGQRVEVCRAGEVLRVAKISRIAKSGRVELPGSTTHFRPDGKKADGSGFYIRAVKEEGERGRIG